MWWLPAVDWHFWIGVTCNDVHYCMVCLRILASMFDLGCALRALPLCFEVYLISTGVAKLIAQLFRKPNFNVSVLVGDGTS